MIQTFVSGLELLINVDQADSVPFVTSTGGIVITASSSDSTYFDKDNGIFVPTGFEANIALKKVCSNVKYTKDNIALTKVC